jgi:hypothetical protein
VADECLSYLHDALSARTNATAETTALTLPADAAGKTVHVLLEVTDGGKLALTRYRRVVLRVGR